MSEAPWDAGLQNERTTLAWLRSALAFAGAGMWVAKQSDPSWLALVVLAGTVVAATGMAAMAERRHRARTIGLHEGRPVVSWPSVALTAAATSGLAVVGLLVVVT